MRKTFYLLLGGLTFCALNSALCAFVICCSAGCKKEDPKPLQKFHSVTYTMYSMNPKFTFNHIEQLQTSGSTDTIRSNNYSVTLQVSEDVFTNEQGVRTLIQSPVDSVYLKAEFEGKKVEKYFKSTGGIFSVSVNLAAAK